LSFQLTAFDFWQTTKKLRAENFCAIKGKSKGGFLGLTSKLLGVSPAQNAAYWQWHEFSQPNLRPSRAWRFQLLIRKRRHWKQRFSTFIEIKFHLWKYLPSRIAFATSGIRPIVVTTTTVSSLSLITQFTKVWITRWAGITYRIWSLARRKIDFVEVRQVGWIWVAVVEHSLPLFALLERRSVLVFRLEISVHSLHQRLVLVDEILNLVTARGKIEGKINILMKLRI
jgi:hypothetical protein